MKQLASRIRAKWTRCASKAWWGDGIDVRFYLAFELKRINDKCVLDIGCNAGVILSEMNDNNYRAGIDINLPLLLTAKRLDRGLLCINADMFELPFGDSSFDVAILANMIEVPSGMEKKDQLLKEARRILKPGGILFATALNRNYARYRRFSEILTFDELHSLLAPYFDCQIEGFNPFPPFPYFLPNFMLPKIPGIWKLLSYLTDKHICRERSCGFFVKAIKKEGAV